MVAPEEYDEPLKRTLKGYWKLRVGGYRVVFGVDGDRIAVLAIRHRTDIYKMGVEKRT